VSYGRRAARRHHERRVDRRRQRRYFVPLLLLDDEPVEPGALGGVVELELLPELGLVLVDELLSVEVELEPEPDGAGAVAAGGSVLDGGDADGVRSPGFSPTRSVLLSLQAVSRPALSATAMTAERNLFISMPPP
jgi:hypothetical protein